SIVSRSSRVSFTSKTIRGSLAMGLNSFLLPWANVNGWRLLAPVLGPFAMGRLLGPGAANRHAAPAARAPPRVIGEHQRPAFAFTRFYTRKIFLADELREPLA